MKNVYILLSLFVIGLNTGCQNRQPVPKQVEVSKLPEGPILPSNLTIIPKDSLDLSVSGLYQFTGNPDTDFNKILTDVWLIARHYEKAKLLRLTISFSGVERYGQPLTTKVGDFTVNNLVEVRKFVDAQYYCRDMSATIPLNLFLTLTPSSPYRSRYATQ